MEPKGGPLPLPKSCTGRVTDDRKTQSFRSEQSRYYDYIQSNPITKFELQIQHTCLAYETLDRHTIARRGIL